VCGGVGGGAVFGGDGVISNQRRDAAGTAYPETGQLLEALGFQGFEDFFGDVAFYGFFPAFGAG
jgi:hypothetical protein